MSDPRAWQDDALCAQTDPDIFLPEKGGSTKNAKRVCAACPVRQECLNFALTQEFNPDGIWGGTSVRERRALRQAAA